MKPLNVRLDDGQYDLLKQRAEAAGMTVSNYVRDWIDASGGGEVVPTVSAVTGGSSAASPPPQPPNVSRETSLDQADARITGTIIASHMEGDVRVVDEIDMKSISITASPVPPTFLAAPVDECPLCSHDRQESDHLGGRPCKFKTSPRRNCGCTFEGF